MSYNFLKKHFLKIFLFISIGCSIAYLLLIGGKYVWADEAYTFGLIKHNYSQLWKITAADVHPPLYYILLKFLIQPFGYSLIAAKIVSVLPYIYIIVFGGLQLRNLFHEKTAILFMVLFFMFPFSMSYAVEVRMYSLAAAFVFSNGIYAYRCYRYNKSLDWVLFAIFGTAAAYTHYFALVSVGIIYFMLFVAIVYAKKSLIKPWIPSVLGTSLLYLPWLGEFIKQLAVKVNNPYWIGEITIKTVYSYAKSVFGAQGMLTFPLFFILSYFLVFLCAILSKKKDNIILTICTLMVPVGTILVGLSASFLVRPIFVIRYIVPAIPLLVLFMAIILSRIKSTIIVTGVLVVALMGGISNYGIFMRSEYETVENPLDASFIEEYPDVDAYVVDYWITHISHVLCYYVQETAVFRNQPVTAAAPFDNLQNIENFDHSKYDKVLLFLSAGKKPNDELASEYSYEYIGKLNSCGYMTDVFLLQKQQLS